MFKNYNKTKRLHATAHEIYGSIVAQARSPGFYALWRVPDTVEGRFETIILHLALVINHLRQSGEDASLLARSLSEAFIEDLDDNFREMGVGDMGVPKRMKKASEAFNGRLKNYGELCASRNLDGLEKMLVRNIAAPDSQEPFRSAELANYALASMDVMASGEWQNIETFRPEFAPAPDEGHTSNSQTGSVDNER